MLTSLGRPAWWALQTEVESNHIEWSEHKISMSLSIVFLHQREHAFEMSEKCPLPDLSTLLGTGAEATDLLVVVRHPHSCCKC